VLGVVVAIIALDATRIEKEAQLSMSDKGKSCNFASRTFLELREGRDGQHPEAGNGRLSQQRISLESAMRNMDNRQPTSNGQ
jgi:hypothetical protein